MSEHIPVFLASDNFYAPFIATTIVSIMKHTKSFVNFYILTDGISDENKRKIDRLHEKFHNWSIEYLFVDTDKYLKKFPYIADYSFAAYNRYLIAYLKPEIKKAVYSDVDVIYCDDIKKMYDIDLEGYGLAAPIEEIGRPLFKEYNHNIRRQKLGISERHKFFQSGNLIIDCDYWRQNNIMEKCFEYTLKYKEKLLCPDLDVLNILFDNKYKQIDYKFSVCTHRIGQEDGDKEMLDSYKNPFCIHYASFNKPWKTKDICFSDYFWDCAKETAFYEDILAWYTTENATLELIKLMNYKKIYRKYYKYKLMSKITWGKKKELYIKKLNLFKKELINLKRKIRKNYGIKKIY